MERVKHKGEISVLMAVYNCQDTVREAIDSILAQTYTNWKFIICDDCSTDATPQIVAEYVSAYPDKFIFIRNEQNSKLAYSLNHCLEYAEGEYCARMDGDDISEPERFEKQVAYLRAHPEVQLVGTAMQQFNETDGDIQVIYKPEHTDKWTLHKQIPFHHATIMTYTEVYQRLGGYTVAERTNRCEDYDLWFRFFDKGYVGDNLHESLYRVRENMESIKRRTIKSRMMAFQTTLYGYRLLGYPKRWLVREFLITLGKSMTPYSLQYAYRRLQQMRSKT